MLKLGLYLSLLSATSFSLVNTQLNGTCGNIPNIKNFCYQKFSGVWYEYGGAGPGQLASDQCTGFFAYPLVSNKYWPVARYTLNKLLRGDKPSGYVSLETPYKDKTRLGGDGRSFKGQYYKVLATDYSNYAVLLTCDRKASKEISSIYVWTRNTQPNALSVSKANQALKTIHYDPNSLMKTNQDCEPLTNFEL